MGFAQRQESAQSSKVLGLGQSSYKDSYLNNETDTASLPPNGFFYDTLCDAMVRH